MPWLRLDSDIFENPKLFGAPHGEQCLFIKILCAMKSSTERFSLSPSYWDAKYWAKRCEVSISEAESWITDLVKRGLIEKDGERLAIHKWREYQPDPTAAERQEAKRERDKSETDSHASHSDTRDVTDVTLTGQDRTIPNQTKPNRKKRRVVVYSDDFIKFWKAYPRKNGKIKAWDNWESAMLSKVLPPIDVILKAISEQRTSRQWSRDDGQFIPHPSTWLHQGRWDDEATEDNSTDLSWIRPKRETDVITTDGGEDCGPFLGDVEEPSPDAWPD